MVYPPHNGAERWLAEWPRRFPFHPGLVGPPSASVGLFQVFLFPPTLPDHETASRYECVSVVCVLWGTGDPSRVYPPSSPHQWPCSSLIGRMVIRYINNAQLYVCETKFRLSVNQRHKHKTRRSVFLTDLMIVWCRARSWGHHTQRSTQSF